MNTLSLERMKQPLLTLAVIGGLGYVGYRLFKINELANMISYKPSGVPKLVKKGSGFVLVQPMVLDNPTRTSLKMKGVDGVLRQGAKVLGTFSSGPFEIKSGRNYFNLEFTLDGLATFTAIAQAIASGKGLSLDVDLNKRTAALITQRSTFTINTKDLKTA